MIRAAVAAGAAAIAALASTAASAQPFDCLSPDPAMWPPPAKPYFMVAFDTSGSMTDPVNSNNSCAYPNNRLGHGRCALKNSMLAFSGQANFGLASYARRMTGCSGAACYNGCTYSNVGNPGAADGCGAPDGCGAEPSPGTANSASRAGANILVPMLVDAAPPPPSNVAQLLGYTDNNCSNNQELFANGCTPMNGILRDMFRYYSNQWVSPIGGITYASPLTSVANGERACRSVNVLLITDGAETCDQPAHAVDAAADLLTGFTKDGITWSVKTFVIDFGNAGAGADNIAAAGGTGAAYSATNEAELSIALANIIGAAINPESCNNVDDNCNGCIDEGFKHYCNVQPVAGQCCAWATPAQRTTCLQNYTASINAGDPDGNLTLLPCTTPAQQQNPAQWLCYDPKEVCDDVDNNCQNGIDDGVVKCGNPAHCPQAEICDNLDNDCDGLTDEIPQCIGCQPSQEICDGCDNDCDGMADDGIPPIPCGLASPPNCTGQLACNPPQPVPIGGCASGGGYGQCSNNPQTEVCDGLDNDCDGATDDNVPPTACPPPGAGSGTVYGPPSQCQLGLQPCNGVCQGAIGPSAEICDGIDNDCDGAVDESPFGVGLPCGLNQPPCTPGQTACVNGALVCQGGTGPQPEVCDGIDNNCNGSIDDAPLSDAPPIGQNGCWTLPGNCCSFNGFTWCFPTGASCNSAGTLTMPCHSGTLACIAGGWTCLNDNPPDPEACDGIDNNCDGAVDNGSFPGVGNPCGSDVGECQVGAIACTGGILDCVGDIGPTPEICDNLDNDCNGVIDNGLQAQGPCPAVYDTMAYPGPRDNFPCVPGQLVCDPIQGNICVGGQGPSPELCNGIDDDCDGTVDEAGPPPDGLDGTVNQNPPPPVAIGDVCGIDVGVCSLGSYACLNGSFACVGGQGPTPEQCDCDDNDCDGINDNPNPGPTALCSAGKDCVNAGNGLCQCAELCGDEFPCPPGQQCVSVVDSQTGMPLPDHCVLDCEGTFGPCASKTTTNATGQTVCAPLGTVLANCVEPPVCICQGQNGCQNPCFGVQCAAGTQCTDYSAQAGTCVADTSCWHFPCSSCDQACDYVGPNNSNCVTNPCANANCLPDEVCNPTADFMGFTCVQSCAGVMCPSGQACQAGVCLPTCDPPCPAGQVCNPNAPNGPVCIQSQCDPNPCTDGACCNPVTGQCGDCPCEGVVCPSGQVCVDGSCFEGPGGTGGGGGSTSSAGGGSASSSGVGGSATNGAGGAGGPSGIWGLPTGGGGCACETGAGASGGDGASWALLAIAIGLARRRRKTRPDGRSGGAQEVV